jgi:hypothetical protein
MAVATGAALRAFDTLEAVLPAMRTTITRAMPTLTAIVDDDLADDFDDRALLRDLRALAHQAEMVRVATNTLGAGIDLLESDELEELV